MHFDPKTRLEQAIIQQPLIMPPELRVVEAIASMSQAQSSCTLIVEQQKLVGIFTEHDVVRIVASGMSLERVTLQEVMTQDLITLKEYQEEDIFSILSLMRSSQIRHLPILDNKGGVLGIITQNTLLCALENAELFATREPKTQELMQANTQQQEENFERKLLEEKLKSYAQQVHIILGSLPDIVLIIDQQKNIQIISTKAISWDVAGTNLLDLMIEQFFQEDTEEIWFAPAQQVLETKEIVTFDYSLRLNNQEIWFATKILPFTENSVVWVARDITDRKQAELALQASQRRYQTLTEASPACIFHTDAMTHYIYVSPRMSEITGLSLEASLGLGWASCLHPDDRDRIVSQWQEAVAAKLPFKSEYRFVRSDGKITWVIGQALPEIGNEGELLGYVGTITDINERKQVEEALKESEQHYLAIIEDQTELIVRFLPEGILTFVNEAYCRYFGLTREEIIGHCYEPLIFEEDREQVNQVISSISLENPVITSENRVIVAEEVRWVQWTNRGIFDEQGELIKLQAVGRDITDRKQIELALSSSQAKLNNILNSTNASIASIQLFPDRTWKYEYWSQGCEMMFGYTAEEFMAEPNLWFSLVLPEDVEQALVVSNESFLSDYPTVTQGEYRFFHKDGRLRWSSFQASCRPHQTSGWLVTVFDVDITDQKLAEQSLREIAQREKAIATVIQRMRQTLDIETIFHATTEELRLLIKCDRVVVYQFHPDWSGQFVAESVAEGWVSLIQKPQTKSQAEDQFLDDPRCNIKTTIMRGTPESVVDSYMQETKGGIYNQGVNCQVIPDIYQAEFSECYRKLLETFQVRAYIIVPIYCGSQLWGLLATYQNSNSRTWNEGEIGTVVQIGIQLGVALQQAQLLQKTQQQAIQLQHAKDAAVSAAKQSAAANRAKSQFLAAMSHELRTPLNGILGYAQILQADKDCTPNQKKGVEIIHQCGTHLLTLINDILDLSKIEAEKLELYPEDFDFPSLLCSLSEIFQLKARQKLITFTYLQSKQLPQVIHADKKRLRQVLMNLLSNAVKFTDQGSVTFKVEVINNDQDQFPIPNYPLPITNDQFSINQIRFQVEDTGIGIDSDQLAKIFLPFEQVGDLYRRAEGTGLGLAITKKIIELMGGKLFVESTPKFGSTFWFDVDLPIVSNSSNLITVKSTNKILGYSGERCKILIVDDRWENRTVLSNLLEPLGFELEEAADGEEGLEKALVFQPDLILVDLVMPLMDGYQMTRRMRQLSGQHIVIIAVSANAYEVDRQKSLEAGCNDFLAKPVQAQDLFDKIQSYLNLSWVFDHDSEFGTPKIENESRCITQIEMTLPPKEELLPLYKAVSIGAISTVEEEVVRLRQLNPEYTAFVTQIQELADEFEYEKIAKLINKSLP